MGLNHDDIWGVDVRRYATSTGIAHDEWSGLYGPYESNLELRPHEMTQEFSKPILSVIIPVFNERDTIEELLRRVLSVELQDVRKEIIIVDDGSADGTTAWLRHQVSAPETKRGLDWRSHCGNAVTDSLKIVFHEANQGKGSALRSGFGQASGDILLIQDADLEYDPKDYDALLRPIIDDEADVVYGSRFLSPDEPAWSQFGYFGNKVITALSNRLTGLSLTDVWTGYKVFKRPVIQQMTLLESGFELELEITSKVAHGQWRIREVPISYSPRSREEGKKITWQDGIKAIRAMVRYRHDLNQVRSEIMQKTH
ncbi:MAG: glycosyltransferase family 2 protein [Nitrospirales bacterium]|nr:glycosyltransferase family 2 protein [Nitrospira sp.]MDR4501510.1 glycosyltransferase family 2 protein [Nitrospirales bacterium]